MSSATPSPSGPGGPGGRFPDTPPGQAAAPGPSLGLAEVLPTQLSPRDREILLLYYEEGLSYQEMADRLGIPLSTCGTRLARAKAHCKTYLTQPPKGGDDAQ